MSKPETFDCAKAVAIDEFVFSVEMDLRLGSLFEEKLHRILATCRTHEAAENLAEIINKHNAVKATMSK